MMKRFYILSMNLALVMLLSMTSCDVTDGPGFERSDEEILVEHCQWIDTAAVKSVLNPDSIEGAENLKEITAESWILVEDSLGLMISQKNAEKRQYPASLTKMMTAKLVLEKGNAEDTVKITNDVFLVRDCRVKLNESYLEGDLLREMMMQSDNDAAYALAKRVGGDVPTFCRLMNEKAAYLGMDSTHFANPNGMPDDSTYSSARNLLTLARYCMHDSTFAAIVGSSMIKVPLLDGRHLDCENTNMLLKKYKGCIGVKTGYTRQAGGCLAVAATRNGVTLYLVLLKSRSRSSRFSEAATLLDYGFRAMEVYHECTKKD